MGMEGCRLGVERTEDCVDSYETGATSASVGSIDPLLVVVKKCRNLASEDRLPVGPYVHLVCDDPPYPKLPPWTPVDNTPMLNVDACVAFVAGNTQHLVWCSIILA